MPYTEYTEYEASPQATSTEPNHTTNQADSVKHALQHKIQTPQVESNAPAKNKSNVKQELIHPANISLSNDDLRAHYDDLRGQMDSLMHENDMLRRGRSSEVYAYSLKISELQRGNQSLSTQIESLTAAAEQQEIEKKLLRDEIEKLLRENANSSSVIKDLEMKCASLEAKNRQLERTASEQSSELTALRQEKVRTFSHEHLTLFCPRIGSDF